MRILCLGDIGPGQTAGMRMRALQRLGHETRGVDTNAAWFRASWVARQAQRRLQRGSIVDAINTTVLEAASAFTPDLVWADKQEFLRPETLTALRQRGSRLVAFTPDPYFTLAWKRTRLMDEALPLFDAVVYCKSYERAEYGRLGPTVLYMPLGYCDEVHRPLPSADARWSCAVGFLGGWEPRRERLLHAVAAAGAELKIFGGYWEFLRDGRWSPRRALILRQLAGGQAYRVHRDPLLARAHQGGEVYGDDYARALSGARIGLGFLRKVWPDQHTTRTFEIPACGSLLLADRTAEHQAFFEEGKEADYFDGPEELIDKVRFYSSHEPSRARIAAAGRKRAIDGRYAYVHRLRAVLEQLGVRA